MGKFLPAIVALVVGIVIGGYGALSLGGGAMMGAGAATGLVTGMCSVVEAAEQTALLTPEQIDQVLARAAENMSSGELPEGAEIAGSSEQCAEALAKLRAAQ
ncbi:hypothetical protein [Ostreiculturibacter nitratireducens]|uniref:hypothetical protein n=1 Tax=Ostreiculturibacter nitratireducens TaxID=3075226 RepID=UPI0031B5D720